MVTELTLATFHGTIENNNTVIVDFWAPWCGPCRSFAPVFEQTAAEHPAITFTKVNTEDQQELAGQFDIRSIPTLLVFREQILLYAQPGALPKPQLEQLIAQVQALNMDDVRREIAAQNPQAATP
ncbi:MAG: thioredoxin [Gammaproteobacteria bacterium]|nr:thioredoxin [Gammaproteobacteria bacterium]